MKPLGGPAMIHEIDCKPIQKFLIREAVLPFFQSCPESQQSLCRSGVATFGSR